MSAWEASVPRTKPPQPISSSPPATTTAPAPSPKSIAVPRSWWSVMRDRASAPQTSTTRARPDSTCAAAWAGAEMKPGARAGGLGGGVDEAGARGVDVDGARALGAELERDVRGDARRHAVGRDRRDDD